MIDAYEIGIQLALQDGVSEGLATIARELAEVDQLIATTNAGLIALTRQAETAVKAVASIGVTVANRAPGPASATTSEPGANLGPSGPRVDAPTAAPFEGRADRGGIEPVAPAVAVPPDAGSTGDGRGSSAPTQEAGVKETVVSPSITTFAPVTIQQVGDPLPVSEVAVPSAGAVPPASAPGQQSSPVRAHEDAAVARPQSVPKEPTSPVAASASFMPAITAAVQQVTRQDKAETPTTPSPPMPIELGSPRSQSTAGTSRTASPEWREARDRSAVPSVRQRSESAAAPQRQAREGGESMTGNVMLDGRLVGYWLSEQMAREASKPPGGTTFFDPRLAPAWNVSGAL